MNAGEREGLRRLAEQATPGPWASDMPADKWRAHDGHVRTTHPDFEDCADEIAETLSNDDAQFIAAFDPPTALALLDALEAAERKVAAVEALADEWERPGPKVQGTPEDAAAAIRAALAAEDAAVCRPPRHPAQRTELT